MNTDMELTYEDIEQPPEDETPPPDAPAGAAIAPVIDTTAIAPQVVDPETLPDLEAAEPGISLNPKYREFNEEGESVRAVFCGFTTMQSQNQAKAIPVAIFQTRTEVFVNAGANLVQQVKALKPQTAVQITYNGKEKTKSGNYVKTFDVRLLVFPKPGARRDGVSPSAAANGDRERWEKFLKAQEAKESDVRQALGTLRVSEWLKAKPGRTLAQAEKIVIETMNPF